MTQCQLITTADMYQVDAYAIAHGTPGITLMENAGAAVVREIIRRWQPRETVVCCGPGNNGGDGFVVARLLEASGWPVRVMVLGEHHALTGDATLAADLWTGPVEPLSPSGLSGDPLVVDALFGAGLSRNIEGSARQFIETVNERSLEVVAIDIPSGIDGNNGFIRGAAFHAALTVTFFRAKPGHYLMPGLDHVGECVVRDIGIDVGALSAVGTKIYVNDPELWQQNFPKPKRNAHKFARGHLVIAGGDEMTGAALLASDASRRIGAGMVTVAAPSNVWSVYASHRPGLMVKPADSSADFQALLADPRINCVLAGPGLGRSEHTREWVLEALATRKPMVLDADGLSAFAGNPEALVANLHRECVLTPHEGEFARLFNETGDKLSKVSRAATQAGATVLLKGPDTVIADNTLKTVINATGTPYLATAGSGDVLSGLIAGLMAQGMQPIDAACAGAWMHGKAAEQFGPGLIAEDIPDLIPDLLQMIINTSSAWS